MRRLRVRVREVTVAVQADTHDAEDDARNASILIWVDGRLVRRAEDTVSVHRYALKLGHVGVLTCEPGVSCSGGG